MPIGKQTHPPHTAKTRVPHGRHRRAPRESSARPDMGVSVERREARPFRKFRSMPCRQMECAGESMDGSRTFERTRDTARGLDEPLDAVERIGMSLGKPAPGPTCPTILEDPKRL